MAEESSPVNVLDAVVALEEHQRGLQELNGVPGTRRTCSRQQSLSRTPKDGWFIFICGKENLVSIVWMSEHTLHICGRQDLSSDQMRTDSAGMFPLSDTMMDLESANFFFPPVESRDLMEHNSDKLCCFDVFL